MTRKIFARFARFAVLQFRFRKKKHLINSELSFSSIYKFYAIYDPNEMEASTQAFFKSHLTNTRRHWGCRSFGSLAVRRANRGATSTQLNNKLTDSGCRKSQFQVIH
ncbi:hypothetical protein HOLleu_41030 [Holothuria leucospilota]|uniref:Uncharacterized protein n=1 Tax=Holothuria leucospilota TaxID=206669 RepID=A0A9Q0YC12_HOLLE|nr:hypothetical protein HOLleu_41030 [Holothuria leucospilota]